MLNHSEIRNSLHYHCPEGMIMIRREHYLAQIRPFADNDLIKAITGIVYFFHDFS